MSEPPDDQDTLTEERRRIRHDCRGALNQILGYSEMLTEQAEDEELEEFAEDLRKIELAGRRLLGLLDEYAKVTENFVPSGPVNPPEVSPASLPRALEASIQPIEAEVYGLPSISPDADDPGLLLVVDDNEFNRDILARRLRRVGYFVETAEDGHVALDMIDQKRFDLVLLDVMMPEISGLEVLEQLRREYGMGDLPVIMATARDTSEDVVEALKLGANDYVTKPLDMPVVLARVAAQMALKKSRDEVKRLNRNLDEAQDRIARLVESTSDALHDVDSWSEAVAGDLATVIGVEQLGVWIVEQNALRRICGDEDSEPTQEQISLIAQTGLHADRDGDVVLPVSGLSGELFGALVIPVNYTTLNDPARRLLESFARQLGGALELKRAREELEEADDLRRARRDEMLESGVDLLRICPECDRCYHHDQATCEDDGAELAMPYLFPYRIAERYRLDKVLGEGGMGTVYKATDERLNRVVAVKVIRPDQFDNATLRMRFEREARAVARIGHKGVIGVFDCAELDDGAMYIVMEYLKGFDMGQHVNFSGPGTPAQVAEFLRQGAAALGAAHAANIIHRDIKPENIFLVPEDVGFTVKILDFGVAKELAADTHLTQTGYIIGTPRYMSPEQILGQTLDIRSDLFSFAAVAYEALSGRRLTLSTKFGDVLVDIVHGEPPLISEVRPGLPVALDEAFERALAKKPEDRPDTVEAWVDSFVHLLDATRLDEPGWDIDVDVLYLRPDRCAESTLAPADREASTMDDT